MARIVVAVLVGGRGGWIWTIVKGRSIRTQTAQLSEEAGREQRRQLNSDSPNNVTGASQDLCGVHRSQTLPQERVSFEFLTDSC